MTEKTLKNLRIILGIILVGFVIFLVVNPTYRQDRLAQIEKERKEVLARQDRERKAEEARKAKQEQERIAAEQKAKREQAEKEERIRRQREEEEKLREEELRIANEREKYLNNSLSTGTQPYSKWYGRNKTYSDYGSSQIKVTAPANSDIVAFIKNTNKKVIAHAYIKAGGTYTFSVPEGRFETFVYYGKGWYPDRDMGKVKGGFISQESVSKTGYETLYNEVLSYTLQLTVNGNFSTKGSNKDELFQ